MEKYIELSQEEIKLGFVSSCVEFVAAELKTSYHDVYNRMKKVKMLKDYVYACYDVLHCDSRENVTAELVDLLKRRESQLA